MKTLRSISFWLATTVLLSSTPGQTISNTTVMAQAPQDVHPWQTECLDYGCYINWFCNGDTNLCEPCPRNGLDVHEDDCWLLLLSLLDNDNDHGDQSNHTTTTMTSRVEHCLDECVRRQEGDPCSSKDSCEEGESFCNYSLVHGDAADETSPLPSSFDDDDPLIGVCQSCQDDCRMIMEGTSPASDWAVEDCFLQCDVRTCIPLHFSVVTMTQLNDGGDQGDEQEKVATLLPSNALQGSPSILATGLLAQCSNLIYEGETMCEGDSSPADHDATDMNGRICLVNDSTKNTLYIQVVQKCAALGGVGVIFYGDYSPRTPNDEPWTGSLSYVESSIPSVSISFDDGILLEQMDKNEVVLEINTTDVGDACFKRQFCSVEKPCLGSQEGKYCDHKWSFGQEGFCRSCPTDNDNNPSPLSCFFSIEDWGEVTGQKAVENCAQTCASSLRFPDCKFCPTDISGFDFDNQEESEAADRCHLCPNNDVLYPDKAFPLFGEGIQCWQVAKFFETVQVSDDAQNCKLAQAMNYVCGCAGSGYAGANTDTKKHVLAWLPRAMAIVSFLSSLFIFYDTCKSKEQRVKVMNQLLALLSIFDMLGAVGFAFTTLPIPEDYVFGPIYGSNGNNGTCTAQGFFIQLGTISAYLNISLALYYMLIIQFSWTETQVNKIRWRLFLAPVVVGLAFAFAGIPHYGPLFLWCNNTANYWPDIPVAVAILAATGIMGSICWHVYRKEQKTKKYHSRASSAGTGRSSSLSSRVFWQSFWYIMAFYVTWPTYLALQYAWAGGSSFNRYGFILTAGSMVPLQGFWNMLVYIRPRYLESLARVVGQMWSSLPFTAVDVESSNLSANKNQNSGNGSSDNYHVDETPPPPPPRDKAFSSLAPKERSILSNRQEEDTHNDTSFPADEVEGVP